MKYTYAYKTSDGTRHEASMEAESREAVFMVLRQAGIRAIKVVAEDGSKANGEVRGVRKRVVSALLFLVALGVGLAAYWSGAHTGATSNAACEKHSPRHQIYGDPAIVERFEIGDFEAVLTNAGDRILAWYAQPGKLMCPKGVDVKRMSESAKQAFAEYAAENLSEDQDINIAADDPREVRELKQIVNGIRQEFRDYLSNGNGTPRSFWRRLNERTFNELRIYERTCRELENEANPTVWDEKNDALRRLGLRTIPNTKDEE